MVEGMVGNELPSSQMILDLAGIRPSAPIDVMVENVELSGRPESHFVEDYDGSELWNVIMWAEVILSCYVTDAEAAVAQRTVGASVLWSDGEGSEIRLPSIEIQFEYAVRVSGDHVEDEEFVSASLV
jgi:hypothetical protein